MGESGNANVESGKVERDVPAVPKSGAEELKKAAKFERNDLMCGMEVSWDDEYVLEFAKKYHEEMKQHEGNIHEVACIDKSGSDYIRKKAELYGNIIGNLQWRITAEHNNQALMEVFGSEQALGESRKKVADFENFKGNLVLLKKAYERFADDKLEVEKNLLARIEKGEIVVPKDFPSVMYVNKGVDRQYSVIYKYNQANGKLSLQACNVVSTGSENRWKGSESYDHSTPETVFYIGMITGLKHPSVEDGGKVYGGEFVDKDQKPYQIFRLFKKGDREFKWTSYLVHPTQEEPLLGETASHGCVRISRNMDLQILRAFDQWYRTNKGVTDFAKFPPDCMRSDNPKMPVVVGS